VNNTAKNRNSPKDVKPTDAAIYKYIIHVQCVLNALTHCIFILLGVIAEGHHCFYAIYFNKYMRK